MHPRTALQWVTLGSLALLSGCLTPATPPAAVAFPAKPLSAAIQEARRLEGEARTASSAGAYAEAARAYAQSLDALSQDENRDPAEVANTLTQLAGCYYRLQFFARAALTYQEALAYENARLGADHDDVLGLQSILAGLELKLGHAPAAEKLQRLLLATEYRLHPRGRRESATILVNLAETLEAQGQTAEAAQCRQEAKDIRHKLCDEC